MRLTSLDEWRSFLDALSERGAVSVFVRTDKDGQVTSLRCALAPKATTPPLAVEKRGIEREVERKQPLPAGLGYLDVATHGSR